METPRRRNSRAGSGFLFVAMCAAMVMVHAVVLAQAPASGPEMHSRWFEATFDGRSALAIEAARALADAIDDETLRTEPITARFRMAPFFALTRFGRWQDMLDEPEPPQFNLVVRATWHYARGLSYVATGQTARADGELAWLRILLQDEVMQQSLSAVSSAGAVLAPAPEVLAGEIAAARKEYDAAIAHLRTAVQLGDSLGPTVPPEFPSPPRHTLGAILIEAGRPADAETVYLEDLQRSRENGWALFGLTQALRAQGRSEDAALSEARFTEAWSRADVTLTASRIGR